MTTRDTPGRATRIVATGAVLLVAMVAAVVSFAHMWEVAHRAGEGWRSYLLPLSVDGLVVAASMSLLTSRRAGTPSGRLAWVALMGGVGASLMANVVSADPNLTARIVAAWPAAAFAVAFELLLQQRRAPAAEPVVEVMAGLKPPADPPEVIEAAPVLHQPVDPVPAPSGVERAAEQELAADRRQPLDRKAAPDADDAELIDRIRRAVDVDGRTPGRRALAREFGVTEHKIRTILDLPATNGRGTR